MMDWLGKKPSKDANHSSISSSLLEVSRVIFTMTLTAFIFTILVIDLNADAGDRPGTRQVVLGVKMAVSRS